MRLLLDSCMSGAVVEQLRQLGADVVWAGEWKPDPGDEFILRSAIADSRIMVTLDQDFGTLIVVHQLRSVGLIRLVNISTKKHAQMVRQLTAVYATDLAKGAIVTANLSNVRVRNLKP